MRLVLSASYCQGARLLQAPGSHSGCLGRVNLCRGVSKNGTMLSPKLLLCPPLCHKRHLTPHRREGVCSALLWRPDEATKTKLRGTESFLVCQMAKPPTSVQLSRLCQPNPPASQGSGALTSRASQG